ncbi:hypothetical protein Daus18300_009240 [Diaporthe australafricana]|uniref:DNA mismatch repair protein S5 domain-containing protein n=1 Tax=Diaporthe australafricana TaxID=127596 RepID=A0ABR3WF43_9PEZI
MSIAALPETTVRLLGSATAISTPVDVIKELLDNSLDAGATSVEILVSPNLVDNIQVRDNGHGIQADDYDSLGRMGYTSKLTSFEELHNFGGNTLGFRGQAVASANSLGRVTVVTRSVRDPTAVKLTISPGVGGIEDQQRASAPVGTTVTVTGLFKLIPVREQVAFREVQKNLAKTKQLLGSYALARPMIRISFKVLGGDDKQTWSYSPRPQSSLREAVVQIFGAGLIPQCVLKTVATETDCRTGGSVLDGPELTIEAILPKLDADLSKLSKGSFFSIDSRPVSTSRGTMKKLLSNFKTQFKKSSGVNTGDRRLGDLFICVNIKCCPGTYDPNIEPSKNQVLFSDESQLLELFEELCSSTYQTQKTVDAFVTIEKRPLTRRTQTRTPPPSSDGPQDFNGKPGLRLDKPLQDTPICQPETPVASSPSAALPDSSGLGVVPRQEMSRRRRALEVQINGHFQPTQWTTDPSSHKMFQEELPRETTCLIKPLVDAVDEPEASIEQSLAACHGGHSQQHLSPSVNRNQLAASETVTNQVDPRCYPGHKRGFVVNMLADPDLSSDEDTETCTPYSCDPQEMNMPPEESGDHSKEALNPWTIAKMTAPARQDTANDHPADTAGRRLVRPTETPTLPIPDDAFEEDLPILRPPRGAPTDLDTPHVMRFTNSFMGRPQAPDVRLGGLTESLEHPQTPTRSAGYDLPRATSPTERSTGRHKLPDLRSHRNDAEESVDTDGLVQTTLSFEKSRESRRRQQDQAQLHIDDVPVRRNPQFRQPKRVKKRGQNQPFNVACTDSGHEDHPVPSRNGTNTLHVPVKDHRHFDSPDGPDVAPMGFGDSHVVHPQTVQQLNRRHTELNTFDGDSRKYLMRRQHSDAAHRRKGRHSIKRTKTDQLPLEMVPSGGGTQHLVLNLDQNTIGRCNVSRTPSLDEYSERVSFDALMSLGDLDDIQLRLQTVISSWVEKTFGQKADITVDLRRAAKGLQVGT